MSLWDSRFDPPSDVKWKGRQPKGYQDTHSFKAFLEKTPQKQLQPHLARNHKGFNPKAART